MRERRPRLESLESRKLLAATPFPSPIDTASLVVADRLSAEGESPVSPSPLYDAMLALGIDAYSNLFGQFTGSGFNFTTGGPIAISGAIDPVTANLQFGSESEPWSQLGGPELFASDDHSTFHVRGGELIIGSVSNDGAPTLKSLPIKGTHSHLFLLEDRLAVVSELGGLISVTVIDATDRRSPVIVQESVLQGTLNEVELVGRHLVLSFPASKSLTPDLERVTDADGERWETQAEFESRLLNNFAEIVNRHVPHHRSEGGGLVRTGPILNDQQITLLPGLNDQVAVVATMDVLGGEPGLISAHGVTLELHSAATLSSSAILSGATSETQQIVKVGVAPASGRVRFVTSATTDSDVIDVVERQVVGDELRTASVEVRRVDSGQVTATMRLQIIKQVAGELQVQTRVFELDADVTSVHLHEDRLYAVSHTGHIGVQPGKTRIDSIDFSNVDLPVWQAPIEMVGFYTYLNFIAEDRLVVLGERLNSGTVINNPALLGLYQVGDHGLKLLDYMILSGPTSGTLPNSSNPYRWFDEYRVLAFPVIDSTFGSGWTGSIWGGGDAVDWVRIDSTQQNLDQLVSLGTHDHNQLVQHSAILDGTLTSISTDFVFTSNIDATTPATNSVDLPLLAAEDSAVESEIERRVLRNEARDYLVTDFGYDAATLALSAIETRGDQVQLLFEEPGTALLVSYNEASGFSLRSPDFSAHENIFHNLALPWDTNGDGQVSPADALLIINALPTRTHPGLSQPQNAIANRLGLWFDANNDRSLTIRDALVVINQLVRADSRGVASGLLDAEGEQTVDAAILANDWDAELF
ncbi:MAG: dockerin type I domain-containing protein [Planctomycetota bacterium]